MRSWESTAPLGERAADRATGRTAERAALIAIALCFVATIGLGVWMGAGSGTRRTVIEEAREPVAAREAFTPRPQSGPVVEIVPDAMSQPDPNGTLAAGAPDAPSPPDVAVAPVGAPSAGGGPTSPPAVRVEQALALIAYDWRSQLPGWSLEISGPRSGLLGLTRTAERQIEVFVRPSMSTEALAHVLAHEIGHAVDLEHLDPASRSAFHVLRGRAAGSLWWAGNAQSDFATGAGDWAESFAFMVTGGRGTWGSELGRPPNVVQQAAMRELIR